MNYLCDFIHVRSTGWWWQHVCPKLQQFSPDHTAYLLKRQKPSRMSGFHLFCSATDVTIRCNGSAVPRYSSDAWFVYWADYRKVTGFRRLSTVSIRKLWDILCVEIGSDLSVSYILVVRYDLIICGHKRYSSPVLVTIKYPHSSSLFPFLKNRKVQILTVKVNFIFIVPCIVTLY